MDRQEKDEEDFWGSVKTSKEAHRFGLMNFWGRGEEEKSEKVRDFFGRGGEEDKDSRAQVLSSIWL